MASIRRIIFGGKKKPPVGENTVGVICERTLEEVWQKFLSNDEKERNNCILDFTTFSNSVDSEETLE